MIDTKRIARALLSLSSEILAEDFPSERALNKYLKKHPGADKTKKKLSKNWQN